VFSSIPPVFCMPLETTAPCPSSTRVDGRKKNVVESVRANRMFLVVFIID